MKKRNIILILVIICIITLSIIACIFSQEENSKLISNETTNDLENISQESKKELQIYDIEEGYLTVPYNQNATLHKYNWDNLSKNVSSYYSYEDSLYESKLGIDVSTYQGEIDWKKVKESGIDFAILRLGFRGYGEKGNLVLDSRFEENAQEATKAGIDIGVYFFSQAINESEAIEEANYVLEKIADKTITYPVCFDLEKIKYDTARTDNLTSCEITKITIAFCEKIKNAGYTPIIYGNSKTFTTRMQLEQLNSYQKWYADYLQTPLYPYDFSIWQYTETGFVNGIKENVDLNIHFIRKENK